MGKFPIFSIACIIDIYKGISSEFTAFKRELEVQERPRKATICWVGFRSR